MGFGRNPHIARAEACELKAREARDALTRARQWREAANYWERAAKHEQEGKKHAQFLLAAEAARTEADSPERPGDGELDAVVLRLRPVDALPRP